MHGLKGSGAPAPQISPEITHSISLENDRPEQLVHQDTHLFSGSLDVAADATHISLGGVRGRPDLLTVVDTIRVANVAAVAATYEIRCRDTSSVGPTATTALNRDNRSRAGKGFGNLGSVVLIFDNTNFLTVAAYVASGLGPWDRVTLLAGDSDEVAIAPFILTGTAEMSVMPGDVNTRLVVSFGGYYRPLAAADLQV